MKTKELNSILKKVIEKIEPPKEDLEIIKNSLKDFLEKVKKRIKRLKINAEIFVGGSFAKGTMIKKDYYDLDIFLRFDKKYKDEEISKLTEKILEDFENVSVIHGSRDYFKINISPDFFIEVIPVTKIKNSKESRNITDLSYSHVKYIKKKIKTKKILDEMKLAKVFCYANNCYGAESYIRGFSGYGLELLVYYYKSFVKFVKAISKAEDKIIIDIEKQYKNKNEIMMDVNGSKLKSPIVLIDPTFKQRNVLAALSDETFNKFKNVCRKFLENPLVDFFEKRIVDINNVKMNAEKNKFEFILLELNTDKQKGDIAGTKLLKFYNHLYSEIERFFEVKNKGFDYNNEKSARCFFVVSNKKELLFNGPSIKDRKNLAAFKRRHKKIFSKSGKVYAKEKIKFDIKEFIKKWKVKNKKKVRDMDIDSLKIIN